MELSQSETRLIIGRGEVDNAHGGWRGGVRRDSHADKFAFPHRGAKWNETAADPIGQRNRRYQAGYIRAVCQARQPYPTSASLLQRLKPSYLTHLFSSLSSPLATLLRTHPLYLSRSFPDITRTRSRCITMRNPAFIRPLEYNTTSPMWLDANVASYFL